MSPVSGVLHTLQDHPRRRNVTTLIMVGLTNDYIRKNLTQNGELQRYRWVTQKKTPSKMTGKNITEGRHQGDPLHLLHSDRSKLFHTVTRGWYHGGRRLSSDDSFHSPTVIPPSALDKPSIMKRYHCRRTCSHTSPRHSPMMVMLHDTQFVECR